MNPQTPIRNSVDAPVCPFAPAKSNQQQVLNLASVSRNLATLFAAAALSTGTTDHSPSATFHPNRG